MGGMGALLPRPSPEGRGDMGLAERVTQGLATSSMLWGGVLTAWYIPSPSLRPQQAWC
jgi:hypothetical protein